MANVKLVLLQDVEDLGLAGSEVSVASGYARNFLIPQGLATKADRSTMRILEARKDKIEKQRADELQKAKDLAAKLAENEITIQMQASDDDRLFGSVTARNIMDKLAENDIVVDHQRIKLEEPIRALGSYEVEVKLHGEVTGTVKVWIVRA
ncbi:50S ribosomal protein L9 [Lentisphaerota bacterium ZTH]|nr:50S ribosomal protein L9 [Lentisphaerota bacterium]WET06566.1 50S ribosomal protein L9 [Lentisphaerota bacterium ZTH]